MIAVLATLAFASEPSATEPFPELEYESGVDFRDGYVAVTTKGGKAVLWNTLTGRQKVKGKWLKQPHVGPAGALVAFEDTGGMSAFDGATGKKLAELWLDGVNQVDATTRDVFGVCASDRWTLWHPREDRHATPAETACEGLRVTDEHIVLATGEAILVLDRERNIQWAARRNTRKHWQNADRERTQLAVSPDGTRLVVCGVKSHTQVFAVVDGHVLANDPQERSRCQFLDDETLLAMPGEEAENNTYDVLRWRGGRLVAGASHTVPEPWTQHWATPSGIVARSFGDERSIAVWTARDLVDSFEGPARSSAPARPERTAPSADAPWGFTRPSEHFITLSVAGGDVCGVYADGSLRCWNAQGELEHGIGYGPWRDVDLGTGHRCGKPADGPWACAADAPEALAALNERDTTDVGCDLDGDVLACSGKLAPPPPGRFAQVSTHGDTACALTVTGRPVCWGAGDHSLTPAGPFIEVDVGETRTCALSPRGRVHCWGGAADLKPPYGARALKKPPPPRPPRFAPHPDAAFEAVAEPTLLKRFATNPDWDHPPFRGPFGPTDDSILVFRNLGYREGTVELYVPVEGADFEHHVYEWDSHAIAVLFEQADDDPAVEAVVIGTYACKIPVGDGRFAPDLCHGAVVLDWDGHKIVEHPATMAVFESEDAAEARTALEAWREGEH